MVLQISQLRTLSRSVTPGTSRGGTMPRVPITVGRQKIACLYFNPVHLLPKYLRFIYEDAKLVSCTGRHLTSVHPFITPWTLRKIPSVVLAPELIFFR